MRKSFAVLVLALMLVCLVCCGSTHEGEVKTPAGSKLMAGRNFEEVIEEFEGNGFTNIKLEKIDDLIFGWLTKDGEVESVSVGGDLDYSPDVWVPADTEVVISYHTFPEENDNREAAEGSENILSEGEQESEPEVIEGSENQIAEESNDSEETSSEMTSESSNDAEEEKISIDSYIDMIRSNLELTANEVDDIHYSVKRYKRTVFVNYWQEGMADNVRFIIATNEGLDGWNDLMENLREQSSMYKTQMDEYGLNQYDLTVCLLDDEDTDYMLAEFTNGKKILDIINDQ